MPSARSPGPHVKLHLWWRGARLLGFPKILLMDRVAGKQNRQFVFGVNGQSRPPYAHRYVLSISGGRAICIRRRGTPEGDELRVAVPNPRNATLRCDLESHIARSATIRRSSVTHYTATAKLSTTFSLSKKCPILICPNSSPDEPQQL